MNIEENMKKFETALGKKAEEWSVTDLDKFSLEENKDLVHLLGDEETLNECLKRTKDNKEVSEVLYPISVKVSIVKSETAGNDLLTAFENKEIDLNTLKEKCVNKILDTNSNVYDRLVTYLILISKIEDFDMKSYEENIVKDIAEMKELIKTFVATNLMTSYRLIEDLAELIFPLRSRYFEKYKYDILQDTDSSFKQALDTLQSFERALIDAMQKITDEENASFKANDDPVTGKE